MSNIRRVVVVGATGKQGGAVVNALLASPAASSMIIYAPTRDPNSASAQKLVAKAKNIKPIKGQIEDAQTIFEGIDGPVDTVYGVTIPSMKKSEAGLEELQGKSLIDAAVENGVKHFVFSSVDRGGSKSDSNPTDVPHFLAKHKVELYLKEKAAAGGMTWTILRPVFFLDNLEPSFIGKITITCWAAMKKQKKLQLVSVKDIGIFAAKAILDPERYRNRAISLAGDELTFTEANQKFRAMYGKDIPRTFGFLGTALKMMVAEMGLMFKWFDDEGYGADVQECRHINPGMQTFDSFLRESHKFE